MESADDRQPYEDIPPLLKDLSLDAACMFLSEPTNPVDGMIRLSRSPFKLQEWVTSAWSDRVLSVQGGGTGAAPAADARSNLGLGTMALQNSDSLTTTGGTLAGNGSGLTALNATNLSSGIVPQAQKWTSNTTTATGNQDNFSFDGKDQLRCNNATLLSLRGLAAGVGGQGLTIVSVGAGRVDLLNQDANSTAANRLITGVAGAVSLAPGTGRATLEYDGDTQRWRVIEHEQGAWITPTFNAADYTANGSMTWTVGSGDVSACAYYLKGRMLTLSFIINTSTVGGTVNTELRRTIPGGFTCQTNCTGAFRVQPGNNVWGMSWVARDLRNQLHQFWATPAAANWTAASNNIYVQGVVTLEVT